MTRREVTRRRKCQLTKIAVFRIILHAKENVPSVTMESLLFKAQVANVSLINSDDAVVLLEETLLLCFASGLQTLH